MRDTSRDGWHNTLETRALTRNRQLWTFIQHVPGLRRRVNRTLISRASLRLPSRPLPLSTLSPYTTWDSLLDRSYSARHLPPSETQAAYPEIDRVTELFRRGDETILCGKSSVLFPYFVQWFIDSILRIDPADPRRNTSTHQIDADQVYGLTPEMTEALRAHEDGLLASVFIDGAEFPHQLCSNGVVKTEFGCLRPPRFDEIPQAHRDSLFAMGSDRGNAHLGPMMFTTLFLREHNRIARLLAREYSHWDDERLFQTARNTVIALLTKLVIEEYINHITPYHFNFVLDVAAFHHEPWMRENWMAVEFNLLYRWHSMLPSRLRIGGKDVPLLDTMANGAQLLEHGLGANFTFASAQKAGKICLFNTDPALLPIETLSVQTGRDVQLASYNDYREMCGFPRATAFEQLSSSPKVCQALREVYGSVDELEFFPGLFAEDTRPGSVIPALMGRIVGSDAFSQIFTNPLLAPGVFGPETFSPLGMEIFTSTNSLAEVLNRNVPEERQGRRFRADLSRPDQSRLSYLN